MYRTSRACLVTTAPARPHCAVHRVNGRARRRQEQIGPVTGPIHVCGGEGGSHIHKITICLIYTLFKIFLWLPPTVPHPIFVAFSAPFGSWARRRPRAVTIADAASQVSDLERATPPNSRVGESDVRERIQRHAGYSSKPVTPLGGVFASGAAALLAISTSLNYPLWVGSVLSNTDFANAPLANSFQVPT
jgi:hypothetical protein